MKYRVLVREVHVQPVEIEAETPDDAIDKVRNGEGNYIYDGLEYSHTLGYDTWTVENA